eukprot:603167-Hanusia_phi.AAC.1
MDLNKWKERYGSEVLPHIPTGRWRWQRDPGVCRPMHALLMSAERVRALVIPKTVCAVATLATSSRKALIISNKKYCNDRIKDLPNAIMDGARLESALTELGWDIEFEVNLTLDDMVEALERFRDS